MFKVVAFYTKDTPYEGEIQNLITSMKKYKIPYIIKAIESRGNWVLNAGAKPELLMDILHEVDHDIVYVDADAVFMKYPVYFDKCKADIALHRRGGKEVLSGTIFIKNNAEAMRVISAWVGRQREKPYLWDQKTLSEVLKEYRGRFKFEDLPAEYTKIFDKMKEIKDPVIVHNQASRRFKKHIKIGKPGGRKMIHGHQARVMSDGTIYFPRVTKQLENLLARDYVRLPNQNRFFEKHSGDSKHFADIAHIFKNKPVYICGKGPSLDRVTADIFKDSSPILCINEAIRHIEKLGLPNPIFAVQQDHGIKDNARPTRGGGIFVSFRARRAYDNFPDKYIFYPEHYKCGRTTLTVLIAMNIAASLGSTRFRMIAFDGALKKNTNYAKCVPYPPTTAGDPKRFYNHGLRIQRLAEDKNIPLVFLEV